MPESVPRGFPRRGRLGCLHGFPGCLPRSLPPTMCPLQCNNTPNFLLQRQNQFTFLPTRGKANTLDSDRTSEFLPCMQLGSEPRLCRGEGAVCALGWRLVAAGTWAPLSQNLWSPPNAPGAERDWGLSVVSSP